MSLSIPFRLAGIAALVWSLQAGAADMPPICKELAKVIPALDHVTTGLAQTKVIEKGSELDKSLRELVGSLETVAKAEKNAEFSKAVESLDKAWDAQDRPGFQSALEQVVANVDRIRRRDCD